MLAVCFRNTALFPHPYQHLTMRSNRDDYLVRTGYISKFRRIQLPGIYLRKFSCHFWENRKIKRVRYLLQEIQLFYLKKTNGSLFFCVEWLTRTISRFRTVLSLLQPLLMECKEHQNSRTHNNWDAANPMSLTSGL
jgi:hypothetical protein